MGHKETSAISEVLRELPLTGHVGFDSLPYQQVKKSLLESFTFNILCVGETGIGKSTLISSLFNTEVDIGSNFSHKHSEVSLKSKKYHLKEKEVPLRLTVTETIGYGDQTNKENCLEPILNFVDSQFEKCLQEELKLTRNIAKFQDTRIHICLYFICPTGHTLKALDLLAIKLLSQKVNVLPLIAKADTLTKTELQNFKSNIRNELQREKVEIYNFLSDDDATTEYEYQITDIIPFAVVGSTEFVTIDGKLTRGRSYPWGIICINNENHSDFVTLREMLIEMHLEDLKRCTHEKHYENYRTERLKQFGFEDCERGDGKNNLICFLTEKEEEMRQKLQALEEEMMQSFVERARKTEQDLVEEERKLREKYSAVQHDLEEQQNSLEEEREMLLRDIDLFRKRKIAFELRKRDRKHERKFSF
ncbi:septin-11 [Trichonephila inaurata madagascariensis]|uniref:Septin n=1 Tax=Trichonephila inaurata madagascariensis TaxID=2747483 RepID=A0A8X6YWU5_9ARAC|nr:septin-11 [Trichonephila inaurata madagascariensis]